MKQYPENIKIGEIYRVKRCKVVKRIRVMINNRAIWCGRRIPNTYFTLSYICGDGTIELRCDITGQKYRYENIKKRNQI